MPNRSYAGATRPRPPRCGRARASRASARASASGIGGRPISFTDKTYRPVVFTLEEGIGEEGKTTAYVRKGIAAAPYNEDPKSYIALSTRCAHLGCPVRFVAAADNFICPCHGGVYDF